MPTSYCIIGQKTNFHLKFEEMTNSYILFQKPKLLHIIYFYYLVSLSEMVEKLFFIDFIFFIFYFLLIFLNSFLKNVEGINENFYGFLEIHKKLRGVLKILKFQKLLYLTELTKIQQFKIGYIF